MPNCTGGSVRAGEERERMGMGMGTQGGAYFEDFKVWSGHLCVDWGDCAGVNVVVCKTDG